MASIENSLKYESEVEPGKVRLITSGEFVRAYNHSAWLFYCCISKYKVIRKYSKAQQKDVYFLGFPVSKLLELINGRVCEKTDFGYDITLKPEEIPAEEGYEVWTKEVPVVSSSKEELFGIVPKARDFLRDRLGLELNEEVVAKPAVARAPSPLRQGRGGLATSCIRGFATTSGDKVRVVDAYKGVEFLGAYVKPYRMYPAARSLRRLRGRMKPIDWSESPRRIQARVNSMLGVLSHYDCYLMRKVLVHEAGLREFGEMTDDCLRFYPDWLSLVGRSPRDRRGRRGASFLPSFATCLKMSGGTR
ncbi:MAG: hypothetical protein J6V72_22025 [Kiritimatiellae bacterium]|nr:hypothetical protein [Kiritimatiellia bacterium]